MLYSTWRKAYGLFGGLSSLSAVQHLAKGLWRFCGLNSLSAVQRLAKGLMDFLAGFGAEPHATSLIAACNPRLAFTGNLKKSGHAAGRCVCSALYKHERCHAKYYPNITQLRALLSQINRLKFRPRLECKIIPRPLYRKPRCGTK